MGYYTQHLVSAMITYRHDQADTHYSEEHYYDDNYKWY